MFGHEWVPATGKVIDRRVTRTTVTRATTRDHHEYVIEVHAKGHEPFRDVIHDPLMVEGWFFPKVGETVRLEVDFERKKVKWDKSDPQRDRYERLGLTHKARKAEKDRFDANAAAAPGDEA